MIEEFLLRLYIAGILVGSLSTLAIIISILLIYLKIKDE